MSCGMKFVWLLTLCLAQGEVIDKLLNENKQLRTSNDILQKQLLQFAQLSKTNITSEVSEDAAYNAHKLKALIAEFEAEEKTGVKAILAEEMLDYMRALLEDANLLGGAFAEVSSQDIAEAMQELKQGIEILKDGEQRKEFNRLYEQLKAVLDHKEEAIRLLQLENARLTGALDSKIAELHNLQQASEHDKVRLKDALDRLEALELSQSQQFESLKQAIQREEELARAQAREDFLKIQNSQDEIITSLQQKAGECVAQLEVLSVEKATAMSKQRIVENTVERLESELEARTSQLAASQEKYEQLTRQLQEDNKEQASFLHSVEDDLKSQIRVLQSKEIDLMDKAANCSKSLDASTLAERARSNRVKDLELQLQEAEQRIDHASKARSKEIDALKIKIKDADDAIASLQSQLDDELKQSSELNEKVRDLTEKASECISKPAETKKTQQTLSQLEETASLSPPVTSVSETAYYDENSDYFLGFQPPEIRSYNMYSSRKRV